MLAYLLTAVSNATADLCKEENLGVLKLDNFVFEDAMYNYNAFKNIDIAQKLIVGSFSFISPMHCNVFLHPH